MVTLAAKAWTVPSRIRTTILRGALALRRGNEDEAGEVLSEALATARSAGLAEDEVIARIELTGWHLRRRRILEAREHIRDAIETRPPSACSCGCGWPTR